MPSESSDYRKTPLERLRQVADDYSTATWAFLGGIYALIADLGEPVNLDKKEEATMPSERPSERDRLEDLHEKLGEAVGNFHIVLGEFEELFAKFSVFVKFSAAMKPNKSGEQDPRNL